MVVGSGEQSSKSSTNWNNAHASLLLFSVKTSKPCSDFVKNLELCIWNWEFVKPCGEHIFYFNFSDNATSFDFQVNLFQNGTIQFVYKNIFTILQDFNPMMKVGLFDTFILTRKSQMLPNQLKNHHNIDLYKELKVWK